MKLLSLVAELHHASLICTHKHLHTQGTPPPVTMDHSRSVILFKSIGSVHVLEMDGDGLWVVVIVGNQSVVACLFLISVTVYPRGRMKNQPRYMETVFYRQSVNIVNR